MISFFILFWYFWIFIASVVIISIVGIAAIFNIAFKIDDSIKAEVYTSSCDMCYPDSCGHEEDFIDYWEEKADERKNNQSTD